MDVNYPGWLWMEPAQYIKEVDDLASLYQEIRDTYQDKIDEAFDTVSRKIGFVVLTSLPVTITVDENGGISAIEMSAQNMKGTLFETVKDVLKPMIKAKKIESKGSKKAICKGDYQILIIWKAGLKAMWATLPILRHEPAHPPYYYDAEAARMMRVHQEPAHPPYYYDAEAARMMRVHQEPAHPPYYYDAEAARMMRVHQEPAHPPYYYDAEAARMMRVHQEPAHPPYYYDPEAARYAMRRVLQEPAHPPYYFDPVATPESDYWKSTIAVIDRMYPELNLGAQIAAAQCGGGKLYRRP
jgi:hypothetical protein